MKLLSIHAKNLFSLGDVSISLDGLGLTLVTGYSEDEGSSNGAGKSSLGNKAILWTLYGETAGGLKAGAVLNRHGKRKCFGQIVFKGIDGKKYTIRRERPAKLTLWVDNADVSAHTAKDTQVMIDKLLGIDFKTFIQTSFFGQGRTVHYPALTPKDQKAVLEQILPMEEVDAWAAYTDKQYKALKPTVAEADQAYTTARTITEQFDAAISRTIVDGTEYESERLAKIEQVKTDIKAGTASFDAAYASLAIVKEQTEQTSVEYLMSVIEEIGTNIVLASDIQTEHWKKIQATSSVGSQWSHRLNFLSNELDSMDTDSKCPVCLRDFDSTTVDAVASRVKQQQKLMDECQVNVEECTKVQVFYNAEHGSATRKIHDLQMDLESKRDQLVRVNQYEGNKAALDAKVEASLAAKQTKLELYEDETNPHIALHGRANEQHGEAADAEFAAYEHYTNLKEELDHLVYWRDVYSKELKLKLFEEACPFLDARVAYHLGRLKNEQITCEFTTVKRLSTGEAKEEFNVKVTSTTGGDGFDSLSGGEQQMVSFAVGLALSDLAKSASAHSSSIVILDEPFTELDERNGEAVVEYLTSEVENGQDTVLLISNEETLKGLVPNRIHVVKRKGITNVN